MSKTAILNSKFNLNNIKNDIDSKSIWYSVSIVSSDIASWVQ